MEKLIAARTRYGINAGASQDVPVTCDSAETERVTVTRRELDVLIDEAVQKDRARR